MSVYFSIIFSFEENDTHSKKLSSEYDISEIQRKREKGKE